MCRRIGCLGCRPDAANRLRTRGGTVSVRRFGTNGSSVSVLMRSASCCRRLSYTGLRPRLPCRGRRNGLLDVELDGVHAARAGGPGRSAGPCERSPPVSVTHLARFLILSDLWIRLRAPPLTARTSESAAGADRTLPARGGARGGGCGRFPNQPIHSRFTLPRVTTSPQVSPRSPRGWPASAACTPTTACAARAVISGEGTGGGSSVRMPRLLAFRNTVLSHSKRLRTASALSRASAPKRSRRRISGCGFSARAELRALQPWTSESETHLSSLCSLNK